MPYPLPEDVDLNARLKINKCKVTFEYSESKYTSRPNEEQYAQL